MVETLTDSGAVKYRAGSGAATWLTNNGAAMTTFINQAEGMISGEAKVDFVAGYSGYNTNKRRILEAATSSLAAVWVIDSDVSGYVNSREAEFKKNVHWATYKECMRQLKEKQVSEDFL